MNEFLASIPDLSDFARELSRHHVRYLIIGGHAVGYHARPRATKDMDVWVDPDEDNIARLLLAMHAYGAPQEIIREMRAANPTDIVWFGRPPCRIDILQSIPGVEFETAYGRAVRARSEDEWIFIISVDDLIANKQAVGRKQDIADVELLRRAIQSADRHD